jgi:hypothetical protein
LAERPFPIHTQNYLYSVSRNHACQKTQAKFREILTAGRFIAHAPTRPFHDARHDPAAALSTAKGTTDH